MAATLLPTTLEEAARFLRDAGVQGHAVRFRSGGTKLAWGASRSEAALELGAAGLDRILEHNVGDLTAVLQAGVPLAKAQVEFASAGQRLALDPPLGDGRRATIGGAVATADSGPLRHRYGGVRDLVIGITVALSDGTIARAGGKVIKNVAGYDLPKLFSGSFGTLGMILSVNVRLHPRPPATATALGSSSGPDTLQEAAKVLARAPLELDSLDVAWRGGRGGLLARAGGAEPAARAKRAAKLMQDAGLGQVDVVTDDAPLWARQRAGQRSEDAALVRVGGRPSFLADVLRVADRCDGTIVGRAALGTSYVELDPEAVTRLQEGLPSGVSAILLDGPDELRRAVDPWGGQDGPALELMRQVKRRFDPAGICNRGVFVGGI